MLACLHKQVEVLVMWDPELIERIQTNDNLSTGIMKDLYLDDRFKENIKEQF